MRKDFANRSARHSSSTRSTKKTKGGGSRKKPQSPVRRLFHGPSFSGGMIFGALLVLTGAYLPELLPWVLAKNNNTVATTSTSTAAEAPKVTFEFDDMLRNANVAADGSEYVDPDAQAAAVADPEEYLLQAASFRSAGEADALRANLLLLSLPATTDIVTLPSGRWYRVTVGPFETKVLAQRAVTQLRQRNLAPLWIKRKVAQPSTLAAGNPR